MMLQCVIVSYVMHLNLTRMLKQIALEGQDLPRTYLAHHELESFMIIIVLRISSTLVYFGS